MTAFNTWYEAFDPFDETACSGSVSQVSIPGSYGYYAVFGGCNFYDSLSFTLTKTPDFWDSIIIGDGAVLQSTTGPDGNGLISKTFNLKSGAGNTDRAAFLMNADET